MKAAFSCLQGGPLHIFRNFLSQAGESIIDFSCSVERGRDMGQNILRSNMLYEFSAFQEMGWLFTRAA